MSSKNEEKKVSILFEYYIVVNDKTKAVDNSLNEFLCAKNAQYYNW